MPEERKSFWGFRMPQLNNCNQGIKYGLDSGDTEHARRCADAEMESLQKAVEETKQAIEERDRGLKRGRDPDVKDGIRY